jgi:molybdenum cofactor cytidylyltransferase
MLTAIILAAGMSRRMSGKNKLLLPFGDKTMLETTLDHVLESGLEEMVVVVGHEADRIRSLLNDYPVKVVSNPGYAAGMTTSIQAGLREASDRTEGFMICLSDMPLIEAEIYRRLAGVFFEEIKREQRVIVQPFYENTPGNPVIFSAFYKNELLALDFPEGCKPVVQANREYVIRVNVATGAVLRDADTPEAFERLAFP